MMATRPSWARHRPDGAKAPWTLTAAQVARQLEVDPEQGLSAADARQRLQSAGANELDQAPPRSLGRMLLGQFANTMVVVLLIAGVITAVIGEVSDTIVIGIIVVLNAVIGFSQERRAETAMAALQRMTAAQARVVRGGRPVPVPAADVVPGDVLLLEAGDIVAADARLLHAASVRVDEATLTGESMPVDKHTDPLSADGSALVAERANSVFKGTAVAGGRGRAVVTTTGMATELGRIAGLLQTGQPPPTPLQRRLASLGRSLAAAALAICVIVFSAGVLRGEPVTLMFLTAVSLAVAAIPEALPAVVTVSLALGARRMAQRHALVRKLPAVETLGSITVVCTDKTGTLTQGRMQVERVWTPSAEYLVGGSGYIPTGEFTVDGQPVDPAERPDLQDLARAAALCNDAVLTPPSGAEPWQIVGDPTEGALLVLAVKAGCDLDEVRRLLPRVDEVPFDSGRKRMTTVHEAQDGRVVIASKGAWEVVLDEVAPGPARRADAAGRQAVQAVAERYSGDGYRVLAIAEAQVSQAPTTPDDRELVLLGLVAMADPIRAESHEAVAACRHAGIRPVMITGDHPATARAIAGRLGLLDDGRRVMTGVELAAEGSERLTADVADVAVYARTTPEQKLDIIEAWRARGDTVAMTGDGVNDAPALRRADIGVAMGIAGSEVSREAADMVLADDNFATIVAAVREGRRIYDNIRRFVRYTLTSNAGEIWVMLLGPLVGLPLPLAPVQILWINLVTDGLPGLALGVEPAGPEVMRRPPRPPTQRVLGSGLWQHVLLVGLLMGLVPLALGVWGSATGRPWQTMVFTSLALAQLGHALAVRSERQSLASLGLTTNAPLLWAVVGTVALQVGAVYWSPARQLLHLEALGLVDLAIVLLASTIVLWVVELEKFVHRRRAPRPAGADGTS